MNSPSYLCSIDPGYQNGGICFIWSEFPGRLEYGASYSFEIRSLTQEKFSQLKKRDRMGLLEAETRAITELMDTFSLYWKHVRTLVIEENDVQVTRNFAPCIAEYFRILHPEVTVRTVLPQHVSIWLKGQTKRSWKTRTEKKEITADFIENYGFPHRGWDQNDAMLNGIYFYERSGWKGV